MVLTTINYLIEHRNLNGAMDDIVLSGVSGVFSGSFLGGITGALTYVKSGINNSWYNSDGSINYPPNNGAIKGTEKNINLKQWKTIGRYGNIGDKSNFVTKTGTNPNRLALPPNTRPSIYQEFEVVKEIPNTIQEKIAAWGGSPGGGIQYELPMPIKQLIREGYIIPK